MIRFGCQKVLSGNLQGKLHKTFLKLPCEVDWKFLRIPFRKQEVRDMDVPKSPV